KAAVAGRCRMGHLMGVQQGTLLRGSGADRSREGRRDQDPALPELRRGFPRQAGLGVPAKPCRAALDHERRPQLVPLGEQTVGAGCRSIAAPSGTSRISPGSPSLPRKRRRPRASSGACEGREAKPSEALEASLGRIGRIDGKVHAFLRLTEEEARGAARASDDRRARNAPLSPIDGVPVALKDIFCQEGVETTAGSRILAGYVPPYDATVVRKLREAGAVLVGKLNMDEFAMGSSSENSAFGSTRNPWDLSRTPGGSSGGSAAAVAAKMVPGTLGTDTGGSIRQPAALVGCVGLKPTYGRVSRYGVVAFASSLDQVGPFAEDVRGAALLLQAIAGRDENDQTSSSR